MPQCQYMEFSLNGHPFAFWWPQGAQNHNPLDVGQTITAANVEAYILAECAARSSSIVEFGTQYGLYTTIMAHSLPLHGRLIGLEILPVNAQTSNENLKINRLHKKALVLHAAIAEADGYDVALIDVHKENASVLGTAGPIHGVGTMEVPRFSLDRLQAFHGNFDMMKMDIEGLEGTVLEAAGASMQDITIAAIEVHPHLMHSVFGKGLDVFEAHFPADLYLRFILIGDGGQVTLHDWDPAIIARASTVNAFFFRRDVHEAFAQALRRRVADGLRMIASSIAAAA